MARRPRLDLPGYPHHVVRRGLDGRPVFDTAADHRDYLSELGEALADLDCALHAHVLMNNHIHLLLTPRRAGALPALMKRVNQAHAQRYNRLRRRHGALWEGRYYAAPIEADSHFMATMRYIERNPVRARLVADPVDFTWSSARANAGGEGDVLLTPHPLYLSLGTTAAARQRAYAALLATPLPADFAPRLRRCTLNGWALGSDSFVAALESRAGHALSPGKRGRPRSD